MIRQGEQGLVLECDACSNYIADDAVKSFKDMSDLGKANGWICRKINEQWYNFCSEECYQQKKAEVEMAIGQTEEVVTTDKTEIFDTELSYIRNDVLRDAARKLLERLPDYFYEVAASSTGKYHPRYALGAGGLVRHTKAAVRVAVEFLRLEMYQNLGNAYDFIIIALLLHDGWKHGELVDGKVSQYTKSEHPAICAEWIKQQTDVLSQECLDYIANLVLTHMGEWNMSYNSGATFAPKPSTQEQCFVHLCDYMASRKAFEFDASVEYVG